MLAFATLQGQQDTLRKKLPIDTLVFNKRYENSIVLRQAKKSIENLNLKPVELNYWKILNNQTSYPVIPTKMQLNVQRSLQEIQKLRPNEQDFFGEKRRLERNE